MSACVVDRAVAYCQCSTPGRNARMAREPALQGGLATKNVRELFTHATGQAWAAGLGSGALPHVQSQPLPQPGGKRRASGQQQQLGFPQKRLCAGAASAGKQPQPPYTPDAQPAVPSNATALCSAQRRGFAWPEPKAPVLVRPSCWQATGCGVLCQPAAELQLLGSSSAASSQSTHPPGAHARSRSASSAPGLGGAASAARPLPKAAEALCVAPRPANTAWASRKGGALGQTHAGPPALGVLRAVQAAGAAPCPADAAWRSGGCRPPGQTGPGPPPLEAHVAAPHQAASTGHGGARSLRGQAVPVPPAVGALPAAQAQAMDQAAACAWPSTGSGLLGQPGCRPPAFGPPGAAEAHSADHGSGARARHSKASGVPFRLGPEPCRMPVPDAAVQTTAPAATRRAPESPRKPLRLTLADWGLPYHIVQVLRRPACVATSACRAGVAEACVPILDHCAGEACRGGMLDANTHSAHQQ